MSSNKITYFQIIVLVLSIYYLVVVFIQEVFKPVSAVSHLLNVFDLIVCLVFIIDFIYQMVVSKNRLKYFLQWGWVDLISSVPVLGFTRWARIARTIRLLRIMKSLRLFIVFILKDKASGALVTAGLLAFLLLTVSSTLILSIETTPRSHIKTSVDALLWAFSSMSSSAIAGEAYPVTPLGKVLSIILLISGMSLFSTFTAFMAGLFIKPSQDIEATDIKKIKGELQEVNEQIKHREEK